MRFSRLLLKKEPLAPFPQSGKQFEQLFKNTQRKPKAWDGQDKDAFFRDKYAHVHAKQMKRKQEEQEAAKLRRKNNPKLAKYAEKNVEKKVQPQPDFASRLTARMDRTPDLEFIYGKNAVTAVLQSRNVAKIFSGVSSLDEVDPELLARAQAAHVPVQVRTPAQHLQIMSENGVHNKYVAETETLKPLAAHSIDVEEDSLNVVSPKLSERIPVLNSNRQFKQPLGLYIDQVTDPHNLGALLRSALWFGVDFVAVSSRNSAPLTPSVVKSSSGASEFIPILETPYPLRFFDSLKEKGWQIVTTAPSEAALKQHNIALTEVQCSQLRTQLEGAPTLLVVGSEGDGIRTSLLQRSTHKTTIETHQSAVNSLNVSVAAAVLLGALTGAT